MSNTDELREAEMRVFEDWMRRDSTLPLDRDSFDYADFHVALMWHAWEARAALAAGRTPPAGMVLVPVEPAQAMVDAGNRARLYREHGSLDDADVAERRTYNTRQAWAAMIAAAQQGQQDGGNG